MAMFVHAAGESPGPRPPDGTFAYAKMARDAAHLAEISLLLIREGISHRRIFESDAPYDGQLMAIGCTPTSDKRIRRLLAKLPLAGG